MTAVPGKNSAAVCCYPLMVDNEEPVVVLIVTCERESFPIHLRVNEALLLSKSLREDADVIRPGAENYRLENAIASGEE